MTEIPSAPVTGPAAWTPSQMAASQGWIYPLTPDEVEQVKQALKSAEARGITVDTMKLEDFPLGSLAQRLTRIRNDLVDGCGVALIRGMPVAQWTEAQSMLAYAGIGVHLGEPVAQNAAGRILDHVRATGRDWDKDPTVRGYQTTNALPFHCDKGDFVALLCLQQGKSGGESCVASSVTIHNALMQRRPDLVPALYGEMWVDHRGEEPEGCKPYFLQPLYTWHKGRLYGRTASKYSESAQRFPEVPRMTKEQAEAIAIVEAYAQSDEFRFDMEFRQGDIQILNNHLVFHSRRAYEDYPEPARWRHLVRMLMFCDAYRDVPEHVEYVNRMLRWWRAHPRASATAVSA